MPSTKDAVKVSANSSKCFSLPTCVTSVSYWLSLSQLALLQVPFCIRYLHSRECISLGSVKRSRTNFLVHKDDSVDNTISVVFKYIMFFLGLNTTCRLPQLKALKEELKLLHTNIWEFFQRTLNASQDSETCFSVAQQECYCSWIPDVSIWQKSMNNFGK